MFFISKIRHVFTVQNYLSCRSNEDGGVRSFKLSLASARGGQKSKEERGGEEIDYRKGGKKGDKNGVVRWQEL